MPDHDPGGSRPVKRFMIFGKVSANERLWRYVIGTTSGNVSGSMVRFQQQMLQRTRLVIPTPRRRRRLILLDLVNREMRWVLHQPSSSPRCWLVHSVRRQRPAGQAEFCSKSYTFRVTFPKVNHPAKNMEKEKRKVKLKKTQELKNETTLVTPKNFTFASSSLTLFCFVLF